MKTKPNAKIEHASRIYKTVKISGSSGQITGTNVTTYDAVNVYLTIYGLKNAENLLIVATDEAI